MLQQDCNGNFYQITRQADGTFKDVPCEPHFEEYRFSMDDKSYWTMTRQPDGKFLAVRS